MVRFGSRVNTNSSSVSPNLWVWRRSSSIAIIWTGPQVRRNACSTSDRFGIDSNCGAERAGLRQAVLMSIAKAHDFVDRGFFDQLLGDHDGLLEVAERLPAILPVRPVLRSRGLPKQILLKAIDLP